MKVSVPQDVALALAESLATVVEHAILEGELDGYRIVAVIHDEVVLESREATNG